MWITLYPVLQPLHPALISPACPYFYVWETFIQYSYLICSSALSLWSSLFRKEECTSPIHLVISTINSASLHTFLSSIIQIGIHFLFNIGFKVGNASTHGMNITCGRSRYHSIFWIRLSSLPYSLEQKSLTVQRGTACNSVESSHW